MAKAFTLTVAVPFVLLIGGNSKPYSREAAEKCFRALVAAKDSDILDLIKNDGLVCIADLLPFDEEDGFLTIQLAKPTVWLQEKDANSAHEGSLYDGKSDLPANSFAYLSFQVWVNQDWTAMVDSSLDGGWHSVGHYETKNGKSTWKSAHDLPPVFRFSKDKDEAGATNVSATEDDTNFYASKTYDNRNNGKTTYGMSVRLSTGRYKETWIPDKGSRLNRPETATRLRNLFAQPRRKRNRAAKAKPRCALCGTGLRRVRQGKDTTKSPDIQEGIARENQKDDREAPTVVARIERRRGLGISIKSSF